MQTKTFLFLCLAVIPSTGLAQSGGPFNLNWSTIDAGGGTSSGGRFSVSGTCGQPDAGTLAGGQFVLAGGFWSGVEVQQVAGAPVLTIKFIGNGQAVLSWPVSVAGFTLKETTALEGGIWTSTPQAVVDTATEHTVTVPANGVVKVFRLKK